MVDLVLPTAREPMDGPCLQSPEHFRIRPLCLPVAPRMSNGVKADLGTHLLTVVLERSVGEFEPLSVMMWLGTPKWHTIPLMNLHAASVVSALTGSASIHLVNLSMAT